MKQMLSLISYLLLLPNVINWILRLSLAIIFIGLFTYKSIWVNVEPFQMVNRNVDRLLFIIYVYIYASGLYNVWDTEITHALHSNSI